MPLPLASGTALCSFFFTAAWGTWLHWKGGSLEKNIVLPQCIGAMIFGFFGALTKFIVGAVALNVILALLIILAGIAAFRSFLRSIGMPQTLAELGGKEEDIKVIGIRHGEKMYETLLTNEECGNAIDMGNFYRVPADNRTLNYDKYIFVGFSALNEVETHLFDYVKREGKALFYWDYDTYYTKDALSIAQQSVSHFAKQEGLTAHAKSAVVRLEEEQ